MGKKRQSSRRDFLKGRAAADRLLDATQGTSATEKQESQESAALPPLSRETYLVHFGRRAMACEFEIFFNAGEYPNDTEAGVAALDLVDCVEESLSVYRETSEISRINRSAGREPVSLDAEWFTLIDQALQLCKATDGALDITSIPLSRAWGFFQRSGTMPTEEEMAAARSKVGYQRVRLDHEALSVQLETPGAELSLNSIGKGYALDRCRDLLHEHEVYDFLLHGGQSSVLAGGSHAALTDSVSAEGGWNVGLRHPLRPDTRLIEFRLRDRALATSGSGAQFFHFRGKRYGHIVDPRTGHPAEGVFSATVLSPSAAEADALSTAFYVMGSEAAMDYCSRHPHLATLMICPGDREGTIRLHTHGLEPEDWRELDNP